MSRVYILATAAAAAAAGSAYPSVSAVVVHRHSTVPSTASSRVSPQCSAENLTVQTRKL